MNLLPDTSALRTRARRIDTEADEVTARCRTLRSAAAQTRWVSFAASQYQARAEDLCADLNAVASQLHHAAATLRAHADSVDRIVQIALSVPGEALHDGEQLAADGLRAVTSLIGGR